MDINRDILAQNIVITRKALTVSQREFAKLMGVAQATVIAYEKGDRAPSLEFMVRLKTITGKSIEELMHGVVTTATIESEALRMVKAEMLDINQRIHKLINVL
jgi:transcriptional regulator with XRE-family HTH domain